jgi:hypothetical protein
LTIRPFSDFNGFYDFYGFYAFYDFNDLNEIGLYVIKTLPESDGVKNPCL